MQEGFLGNLGRGIGQFAQNVWSGGGVTGGAAQFKDTNMGPGAKFDTAVKTLENLVVALKQNNTKDMKTADGTPVHQYIQSIISGLEQVRNSIPRMQAKANTQPEMAQGQGQPGQQGQQKSAMDMSKLSAQKSASAMNMGALGATSIKPASTGGTGGTGAPGASGAFGRP